MKQAFIWTREHSPHRLRQLDDVKWAWEHVFGENRERGHYMRIQWAERPGNDQRRFARFTADVDGMPAQMHLTVLTAREWFVRTMFQRALAKTRERYPDFEAHHFVDGDRVGERRVVFHSERNALSSYYLWSSLWQVVEEKPSVQETWFSEPCNSLGWTAAQIDRDDHWCQISPGDRRVTVIRRLESVTEHDVNEIVQAFQARGGPDLSTGDITFSWSDIRGGFTEMSDPELVVMNWADARPVPSAADIELQESIDRLDIDGIRKALTAGANPSCTSKNREGGLASVIRAWRDHWQHWHAVENELEYFGGPRPERLIPVEEAREMLSVLLDAGAHPDRHEYNETPAITDAVLAQSPELVSLLLERGADPSVGVFWDDGPGIKPAAWDYAMFDGFSLNEAGAREAYFAMIRHRSSPAWTQQEEEEDRREADLPDHLRSWNAQPYSFGDSVTPSESCGATPTEHALTTASPSTENRLDPEPHRSDDAVTPIVSGGVRLTEHAAAMAFASAWNRLDPEPFLGLLAPDARYASQWVFEELKNRQAIADYLRAKMNTVRDLPADDPYHRIRAELATSRNGQDCVAITQGENNDVTAVVVFTVEGGRIQRFDMCIPQLMNVTRSGVYPV